MKVLSMKVLIAALLLSTASVVAMADDIKIGYVNSEQVKRESDAAKRAQARLDAEFKKREKDLNDQFAQMHSALEKLDKDAPTLSEGEKARRQRELVDTDRDLQRKKREFQEDLAQRSNEELNNLAERTNRAVKQIFDAEHFDLILVDQAVYLASPRVDITKRVIGVMNTQK
jgi:outer membrane protein